MAGNGDAQRLEKLEVTLRGDRVPAEEQADEFTLGRLAEFFIASGQQKREATSDYGNRMVEMVERELAYVKRFVGKLK